MPAQRKSAKAAKRALKDASSFSFSIDEQETQEQLPSPPAKRRRTGPGGNGKTKKPPKQDASPVSAPPTDEFPSSSNDNDNAVDDGPSQQILQALEKLKSSTRKSDFLPKLAEKLRVDRAEFDSLTEEVDNAILKDDVEFTATLTTLMDDALGPPTPLLGKGIAAESITSASLHPLHQNMESIFKSSAQLITRYKEACDVVGQAKPDKTLGKNWGDDHETVVNLLNTGRRIAQRQIDREISKHRHKEAENTSPAGDKKDNLFATSYFGIKVREESGAMGLSEVLISAEKGMQKITAQLPRTDG